MTLQKHATESPRFCPLKLGRVFSPPMGMICSASAGIYDANEAIRVNNTGPRAQELLAKVDVTRKGRDGRIPFVQACKYGRQRMVEFMIKHDIKQRITAEFVDAGLLQACGGDTTRNLVFILVEVAGANVNAQVNCTHRVHLHDSMCFQEA